MASITLCPRCSSHLELPAGLTPTSLVECPICEAEFLLASVAPRAIPKVRLVEQDIHHPSSESDDEVADEATPTREPLGIIVDDDDMATEPEQEPVAESTDDKLSRLLRSTSSWQLPGASSPEAAEQDGTDDADGSTSEVASFEEFDAEIDDRIIPNDHAPRPAFGATLDAAYRDADPETAAPAAPAADELKLGGSRLDQLLSDLMKTPPAPLAPATPATPAAAEVEASPSLPASPTFAEFESDERAEAERETTSYAEVAETELAEYDAVDDEPQSIDAADDESFEDRWRRLQATSAAAEAGADAEEDPTAEEYADAIEDDGVTYEASAEAESEHEQWTSDEEFDELERSAPVRRRRRPSVVKTLVGVVGGGFIGIFLAGYGLLWLKGPDGDLLGIANLLPAAMLPGDAASASQEPLSLAEDRLPAPAPVEAAPLSEAASPTEQPGESTLAFANEPQSPASTAPGSADVAEALPSEPPATLMHHDAAVMPTAAVEPADTIQWPTTPIVGELKGVPLFSLDDLSSHIASADAAHRTFLAGDLARKEDVAAMGQAYIELCKLAERFTLTDPKAFGNDLVTKQMAAKQIFRGAVGTPARRNDLAMIAGRWLEHARRPNQGVLLLGRVTDLQPQGKWTEYTIETPLGSTVSVNKVLMDKIDFKFGDEVAVVGAIVANPSQSIAGYTGDAKQVVVAGFAFAPEDFVAPQTGATADLFTP